MPSLRMKQATPEGFKDQYCRFMRLLELKKKEHQEVSPESKEDTRKYEQRGAPLRLTKSKDGAAVEMISLTPKRVEGVFDLPAPLLANILSPRPDLRSRSSASTVQATAPTQICLLCSNDLEVVCCLVPIKPLPAHRTTPTNQLKGGCPGGAVWPHVL